MIIFVQSTGKLFLDDEPIDVAYSGHGAGVNNPEMQGVSGIGPIPVGLYTIGPAFDHPHAGPVCMRLYASGNTQTYGRDGFMIHGDNALLNHTASEGCIITSHATRELIARQAERKLTVKA